MKKILKINKIIKRINIVSNNIKEESIKISLRKNGQKSKINCTNRSKITIKIRRRVNLGQIHKYER